jgi:hypothetical protein
LVGALLLVDSVSQWVQVSLPMDPASPSWRVTTIQRLFTQVTPLTAGILLLALATNPTRVAYRTGGILAGGLAAAVLGLAVAFARDAGVLGASVAGTASEPLARGPGRTLLSAVAFGMGLLAGGFLLLRGARRIVPAEQGSQASSGGRIR